MRKIQGRYRFFYFFFTFMSSGFKIFHTNSTTLHSTHIQLLGFIYLEKIEFFVKSHFIFS